MGVRVAEERLDRRGTQRIIAARDDLIQVEHRNVLASSDLARPAGIGVGVADDLAVLPDLARNQRAEDGFGAARADVLDVAGEVPAEGMDRLVAMQERILNLDGLVADMSDIRRLNPDYFAEAKSAFV